MIKCAPHNQSNKIDQYTLVRQFDGGQTQGQTNDFPYKLKCLQNQF